MRFKSARSCQEYQRHQGYDHINLTKGKQQSSRILRVFRSSTVFEIFKLGAPYAMWVPSSFIHTYKSIYRHHYSFNHISIYYEYPFHRFQTTSPLRQLLYYYHLHHPHFALLFGTLQLREIMCTSNEDPAVDDKSHRKF